MQTSRAQTFNRTAALTHDAFRRGLENLLVVMPSVSDVPVYVAPEVAARLTQDTAAVRAAVREAAEYMQRTGWLGFADKDYPLARTRVNLIALRNDERGFFYPGYTQEMSHLFVLNHELAHHFLRNGTRGVGVSSQQAESACDAFAMLRHIQIFGMNTAFFRDYADRHAASIVLFADSDHFTTKTIRKVMEVAQTRNIPGMSLEDMADLAADIADDNRTERDTLNRIRDAFQPVNDACMERFGDVQNTLLRFHGEDPLAYKLICKKVLDVMEKNKNDAEIFDAGRSFLTGYPSIRNFMRAQAQVDDTWKKALRFINPHARKKSRNDRHFGI